MKKALLFLCLAGICSCNAPSVSEDEFSSIVGSIEEHLDITEGESDVMLARLKRIERIISYKKRLTYVIPEYENTVSHGDEYKAMVLVRDFNLLQDERAFIILNDSILPLEYDSVYHAHMIDIKSDKLGLNDCSGLVLIGGGRDTLKFDCNFFVERK